MKFIKHLIHSPYISKQKEVYSMIIAPPILSPVGQRIYIFTFFTIYIIYNQQLKRQGFDSSPLKRAING